MNIMLRITVVLWTISTAVLAQSEEGDTAKRARRENDVVRAVRAEKDAVVNISTTLLMKSEDEENSIFQFLPPGFFPEQQVPVHSLGSGFIIHKDGYIITNAHVIQQAQEVTVSFADKTTAKAQAVYPDYENDLAVVKIKPAKPLHVLPLGRGDDLMIGETVIAIGNPMGYQHTVTVGSVSADKRTMTFPNGQTYRDLIQTDAAINPGNSGGPLLNINGELIGINSAIRGDAQNLGFAINVETLKRILPDLLGAERIRRANLGLKLSTHGTNHIRVVSINEDSPAAHAGLKAGDVITAYDGKIIFDPVDFYVNLLERPVGEKLNLTVSRGGKKVDVSVPFEIKPKPNGLALARKHLGLALSALSAQQAQRMGLSDKPVFVVERTVPGSPASTAKIRKGDLVLQLDGNPVGSPDQVGQILESARPGQTVTVGIARIRGNILYQATVQLKIQ